MTEALHILVPASGELATTQCWSCGEMRAAMFCDACGKLQPATPTDYFSFFGLPRKLTMDTAALEREYYQLSRKLHPDLYANTASQEQMWSLEKTSQLNDAYRTLRDPIARTEYLLKLEGVQMEEQSQTATANAQASGAEKKQAVPADLLEEVFDLNMQLQELRANRKMGERDQILEQQLRDQEKVFAAKLDSVDAELRTVWINWDGLVTQANSGETVPEAEYASARDSLVALLNKRSYTRNLVRDVKDALTETG